jgi:hypothetical protein
MEIKPNITNQIIGSEDAELILKLTKEYGLNPDTLNAMIQEELEHQGMARRVGLITKLHKLTPYQSRTSRHITELWSLNLMSQQKKRISY